MHFNVIVLRLNSWYHIGSVVLPEALNPRKVSLCLYLKPLLTVKIYKTILMLFVFNM